MAEQAGPGRDSPTESLRFFKNRPTPPHLRPLRRETPSHPGDLVRIVRLVRTFLQEQKTAEGAGDWTWALRRFRGQEDVKKN
jgi:hypothetical protein